jgi:hypothetical protein
MKNKSIVYIIIVNEDKQLKVYYSAIDKNGNIKRQQVFFQNSNNLVTNEIKERLYNLKNSFSKSRIINLISLNDEVLISKNDLLKSDIYETVLLNDDFNLKFLKNDLDHKINSFDDFNIDLVYSPFHILDLYVKRNSIQNSLLTICINSKLYFLIIDNKDILYSGIKCLSRFSKIDSTKFYENSLQRQKLFDEIYFLEIETSIRTVIKDFYLMNKNSFIEDIFILYTVKDLNDEQITNLQNDLLIDIQYKPIVIDDLLIDLSKEENSIEKSFIKCRKNNKLKSIFKFIIFIIVLIFILLIEYKYKPISNQVDKLYSRSNYQKNNSINIDIVNEKRILLPNHKFINNTIKYKLSNLFDHIWEYAILKNIVLNYDSSNLDIDFIKNDISKLALNNLESNLSKIYKHSKISINKTNHKKVLNAKIFNQDLKLHNSNDILYYYDSEFISQKLFDIKLKDILPKNSIIYFNSSMNLDNIIKYYYKINIILDSVLQLFSIFDIINSQKYSINIIYPLNMKKLDNRSIEVEFNLEINQIL